MNLPAWDLSSEYPSFDSNEFRSDEKQLISIIETINQLSTKLKTSDPTPILREILINYEQGFILTYNLMSYLNCAKSIDSTNESIKAQLSKFNNLSTDFFQCTNLAQNLIKRAPQDLFDKIFSDPSVARQKFFWSCEQKKKDFLLSDDEESLLTAMEQSGFHAWSELYRDIGGNIKIPLTIDGKTEEVGLAHASALIRGNNQETRRIAWQGIQDAWKIHQESAATILNSLAGWRLETYKKRSHTKKYHFLDESLFNNRLERQTLDAMFSAIEKNLPSLREGVDLMAKMHGQNKLNPWDLLAPAPLPESKSSVFEYQQGIDLIKKSFHKISPEMSKFVDVMLNEKRLEARVLPSKSNGGYCATFTKSRSSVVFQTYMGSSKDLFTLAHELGHAYHSWVLKDVSILESEYTSSLAETASIFAETLLSQDMIQNSNSREEKIQVCFNNVEHATSLLINIPARFEFEKNFYQKRQERALSARELCQLTDEAWTKWYGNCLSENDTMYWASKLHFSMSQISFYNFPYTFGYLFALSIYARKDELGNQFHQKYVEILRDTGRMTAEDLIMKHLGEDIRREDFWQKAIRVPLAQIQELKDLISAH